MAATAALLTFDFMGQMSAEGANPPLAATGLAERCVNMALFARYLLVVFDEFLQHA